MTQTIIKSILAISSIFMLPTLGGNKTVFPPYPCEYTCKIQSILFCVDEDECFYIPKVKCDWNWEDGCRFYNQAFSTCNPRKIVL